MDDTAMLGGSARVITTACIQTSAGYGLSDSIRSLGGEPRRAFADAGVDAEDFDDPARIVSLDRFVTLLECAARVTRRSDFGFRFAETYDIRRLGPVGYLIRHGRTLGEALGDYARHFNSLQSGTSVALEVSDALAAMTYRIDDAIDCERRQDAEFSTAIVVDAARRICGTAWHCHEIQFEHPGPRVRTASHGAFAAPVRFGAPCNAIVFPAALLGVANPEADPLLVEALRRSLSMAPPLGDEKSDIVHAAQSALMRAIEKGRRSAIRDIAEDLGCSVRGLQRLLAARGVTFHALTSDVRIALAERYLTDTDETITAIALKLGFSETSAFSRAFKAHTGQPPRAFRRAD